MKMRVKSSAALEGLKNPERPNESAKLENRGSSLHRATEAFLRKSTGKKTPTNNVTCETESIYEVSSDITITASTVHSGLPETFNENVENKCSKDSASLDMENNDSVQLKINEVYVNNSNSDDTFSHKKEKDTISDQKSPNSRKNKISEAMKRISASFDKEFKGKDKKRKSHVPYENSDHGSCSESERSPVQSDTKLTASSASNASRVSGGQIPSPVNKLAHVSTKSALICPSTAASLAVGLAMPSPAYSEMPHFEPQWKVEDGWRVRAVVVEAKGLPSWPSGHKPRTYVSVNSGMDGKNHDEKHKTNAVGEKSDYGSNSHTVPKWNQSMELDRISDQNDKITFKVYVTTSAAGVVVDHKIGQISFPVRFVPMLDCVPDDTTVEEAVASGPAIVALEKNDDIDPTAIRQIDPLSSKPIKLWLKLSKPRRLPLRLQAKSYKPGWVCVVLSLIPAPADEDMGPDLCGEDEGDAAGTVAPAPADIPPHHANLLIQEKIPCSLTKLNRLVFGEGSAFVAALHAQRNYTEINMTSWELLEDSTGEKKVLEYIMPASGIVKANRVTETFRRTSPVPGLIVVEVEVQTPEVPYGSSFSSELRYIMTCVDPTSSSISVSGNVNFVKSTMMARAIENGAGKGFKQAMTEMIETIQPYVKRSRKKTTIMASTKSTSERLCGMFTTLCTLLNTTVPVPVAFIVLIVVVLLWNSGLDSSLIAQHVNRSMNQTTFVHEVPSNTCGFVEFSQLIYVGREAYSTIES
eukprot:CFRG4048T1